jgi:hypothetical protein
MILRLSFRTCYCFKANAMVFVLFWLYELSMVLRLTVGLQALVALAWPAAPK